MCSIFTSTKIVLYKHLTFKTNIGLNWRKPSQLFTCKRYTSESETLIFCLKKLLIYSSHSSISGIICSSPYILMSSTTLAGSIRMLNSGATSLASSSSTHSSAGASSTGAAVVSNSSSHSAAVGAAAGVAAGVASSVVTSIGSSTHSASVGASSIYSVVIGSSHSSVAAGASGAAVGSTISSSHSLVLSPKLMIKSGSPRAKSASISWLALQRPNLLRHSLGRRIEALGQRR